VAVLDTASGRAAAHRAAERFPMCSTFKLLLAGAVLARIDAGAERPERLVPYGRDALVPWSPVTEGAAGTGLSVAALIEAILTQSDNTAANLLLDIVEGPAGLTRFLRGLGDEVTRLDRMETALNEARPGDPRDTATPGSFLRSMAALTLGPVLSPPSRERLLALMRASRTGDGALRAALPPGWVAADRTGAGGHGTRGAVGLLSPPGGRPPSLVAAFLTEGPAPLAARDAVLAAVAAAVVAAAG
jgi:beta-lactamase class A